MLRIAHIVIQQICRVFVLLCRYRVKCRAMNKLNELDSLRNTKEEQEFNKKYGAEIADFNAKYSDTLQIIYKKYTRRQR